MAGQFGGVQSLIPKFKPIAQNKNQAPVGAGSVAGIPKTTPLLKVTPSKSTPMMSVNPTPPMSVNPAAPNMSTVNGPVKGTITPNPQGKISSTETKKTTKVIVPKITTQGAPTNTQTPTTDISRINTTNAQAQLSAGNITQEQYDTVMGTTAPDISGTVAPTLPPEETPPATFDPTGGDIAQSQAEYEIQVQKEKEYATSQRAVQTQINDLTGEMATIQASERITKAQDSLANLKQNVAYLGSMGQPGQSQKHLDAIGKQLSDADTTFTNLKKLEINAASARTLGLEADANTFEKQMSDLQDKLDQNVNSAIQEAMNGLTAAQMAGKIDTVEEVTALKGTLFQNLDKAIAGKAIANAADRKLIIDHYNQVIATTEAFVKNKSVVNEATSKAQGVYIDGNGNPMVDGTGKAIPFIPDVHSSYDASTGILVQYDDQGNFKATPVSKGAGDPRKQDSTGGFYRTGADGSLETFGGNGGKKPLTVSEQLAADKALAAGEITQARYNELTGGATQPTPTQTGPGITTAKVQSEVTALTAGDQKYSTYKAECGRGANQYLNNLGIQGNTFVDPISAKTAVTNSQQATVGSVAVFDRSNMAGATADQKKYGHTSIVTKVDANGTPTEVADWNWKGDKQYTIHGLSAGQQSAITGYFDPALGGAQPAENQDYLYGDFIKTIPSQGANIFNTMNETDKLNVMQVIKGDALVSDIAKGMGGAVYAKKLLGLATKVDPSFSENTNKIRFAFQQKWNDPVGKAFINRTTINTALGHTAELAGSIKSLDNTSVNLANSFKNIIKNNIGNPSVPDFNIIMTALAGEMAGLYKGATPTDQETEKWYNSITSSYSPKTFNQLLNRVTTLASDRIRSMTSEYKSSMGKLPEEPLVQDYFLQQLKDAGVDTSKITSIPGANSSTTSMASQSTPTNIQQSIIAPSPYSRRKQ